MRVWCHVHVLLGGEGNILSQFKDASLASSDKTLDIGVLCLSGFHKGEEVYLANGLATRITVRSYSATELDAHGSTGSPTADWIPLTGWLWGWFYYLHH